MTLEITGTSYMDVTEINLGQINTSLKVLPSTQDKWQL